MAAADHGDPAPRRGPVPRTGRALRSSKPSSARCMPATRPVDSCRTESARHRSSTGRLGVRWDRRCAPRDPMLPSAAPCLGGPPSARRDDDAPKRSVFLKVFLRWPIPPGPASWSATFRAKPALALIFRSNGTITVIIPAIERPGDARTSRCSNRHMPRHRSAGRTRVLGLRRPEGCRAVSIPESPSCHPSFFGKDAMAPRREAYR